MDLGFESLRDRQLFMNKTIFRKFKRRDSREVIELWNLCKLLVPWNDPKKDIFRKLSVKDNLFIIGENNKKIIASAMGGYDGSNTLPTVDKINLTSLQWTKGEDMLEARFYHAVTGVPPSIVGSDQD